MNSDKVGPNDNVFESIGIDKGEANALLIKSILMIEITKFIQSKGFSLRKAGEYFGVNHSRINDILKGNIDQFTIDYMVKMVVKTGKHVHVDIKEINGD